LLLGEIRPNINVPLGSSERSVAIDGITKSVDDTAEQFQTNWNVDDGTGTLDDVTFLDQLVVTEDYDTDVSVAFSSFFIR